MRTLDEFLLLDSPASTISSFPHATSWYRYLNPEYIPKEYELPQDLWRLFDGDYQWSRRGRFSGSDLNTGHFFGASKRAAKVEMNHYRDEVGEFEARMPLLEARFRYSNVLNLTEETSITFIFDNVLEFPYRRRALWLALLASFQRQGNLITDIVGAWAFHKGYSGVWFLSARALEHLREDFDPTSIEDKHWGSYWTSMAEEFDIYFPAILGQKLLRAGIAGYLNAVYFDGARLLSDVKSFSISYPDGRKLACDNPYESWPVERVRALGTSRVLEDDRKRQLSLERLARLRESLRRKCHEMMEVRRTSPNQIWGEWIEDNILYGLNGTLASADKEVADTVQ